jgi:cytochrome c-type biogenesis protein CcmH/NrfF
MRALAAVVLAMLALPGIASGAQATLVDLEDEVMCPICGTLLELAEAPQAQRQRAYIAGLIAEGKSKAEIKDALVAEYGNEVLALPEGSGFNLSAYLAPAIGFAVALIALGFGVARWRHAASRSGPPADSAGPGDEDAKRLEDDLARYDL